MFTINFGDNIIVPKPSINVFVYMHSALVAVSITIKMIIALGMGGITGNISCPLLMLTYHNDQIIGLGLAK